MQLSEVSVVLPSLDPDEKLDAVIDGLLEYGFTDIILVNDGSKPENLPRFQRAADTHKEVHLLHHEVNRGKGAALKTAFAWFLENRPDGKGVVTVDGDNQHHPEDTRRCAQRMLETGKVILGCRDFNQPDVPKRSRFGNHTTSHFHVIKDSWRIYKLILAHFFRYTVSSLVSACVDSGLFYVLDKVLVSAGTIVHRVVPTVGARVVSSLLNFFLNKKVVFQSEENTGKAMLKYYLLALPQMAAQLLLTDGVCQLLGVPETASGLRTLWYVIVMVCLYFISYTIQQRWVFVKQGAANSADGSQEQDKQ